MLLLFFFGFPPFFKIIKSISLIAFGMARNVDKMKKNVTYGMGRIEKFTDWPTMSLTRASFDIVEKSSDD